MSNSLYTPPVMVSGKIKGTSPQKSRVNCRGGRGPMYNFSASFAVVSPSCPMRTLSSIEDLNFAAAAPAPVIVQKATDHALLEGTLAGDEDAFAELVSRYRNQITSYIYRMTNDYDGAGGLGRETLM